MIIVQPCWIILSFVSTPDRRTKNVTMQKKAPEWNSRYLGPTTFCQSIQLLHFDVPDRQKMNHKKILHIQIYIYKHLYLVSLSWSIYAEKQSYPIFTSNNVLPCRPCNTKQPCSKWDIFLATSSAVEFHNSQYTSYCEIWIALLICCPSTSRLQKLNVRFRCHSATENPETRTAANNCVSPVMILSSVKPHQKKGNSHSQSAIIVSNKRPLPSFTHTWLILKKVIYALFVASMRTILSQK